LLLQKIRVKYAVSSLTIFKWGDSKVRHKAPRGVDKLEGRHLRVKPWAPPSCFLSFSVSSNAFPIRDNMAALCLLSSVSRPLKAPYLIVMGVVTLIS